MSRINQHIDNIFNIASQNDFENSALEIFHFQATNNPVYKQYLETLNILPQKIDTTAQIPFLPIDFFKSHQIKASSKKEAIVFTSSGTSGLQTSNHFVTDVTIYEKSFLTAFELFYGHPSNFVFIGLLPSYLEREGSSLVYMVNALIEKSQHPESGFYLHAYDQVAQKLRNLEKAGQPTVLIGVSYALLDLIEQYNFQLKNTIVMETGGMKGKRKEMVKAALHEKLKKGFGVLQIHAEYGMTELLSQAYSKANGKFNCPPWMNIRIRDAYDPFTTLPIGKSGGINIIDLANVYSCSFIETKDLGKKHSDGSFEVLGRFDNSDIRGCNLMVE